jgi:hypothetical protein
MGLLPAFSLSLDGKAYSIRHFFLKAADVDDITGDINIQAG